MDWRHISRLKPTSSLLIILVFVVFNVYYYLSHLSTGHSHRFVTLPLHAQETLRKCQTLHTLPGVPDDFSLRATSDRFQPGTEPILIQNATIWTGRVQGLEIIFGDILVDGGIIKHVGHLGKEQLAEYEDVHTIDAKGSWVTPGIIDVHSHLGAGSTPAMDGADDTNSVKGLILPWLRSLDGLNTHDEGYASAIAGGLTTALILPGSANAIGGQAFVMKLRPTAERSPTSMLLEPPLNLNGSGDNYDLPPRWRHMKHACGENPSDVYSGTRMDTVWAYRQAYDVARQIKTSQDEFCEKAVSGQWDDIRDQQFPESLQWEALVDVLRGRVKVQTHCYEAVDIDAFVRLTNEFQFPVAAFHHAHEAWLVPDVLKGAYGHTPAIAMFAAFARYKREAYRHSEFAPRVLADNDVDVVMKSDHNAIVSRYLIHEAAQAHYYGLEKHIALSSVTTTAAKVLGLDHRIGYIKAGYDADIVIWDSHPLALGATPTQVIIDGIVQLRSPHTVAKSLSLQHAPNTPNFDKETADAVEYEGLPPLTPLRTRSDIVVFTNVSAVFARTDDGEDVVDKLSALMNRPAEATVVVERGKIICQEVGPSACASLLAAGEHTILDLQGGAIQPALVSAGSKLGLQDIALEPVTNDGPIYDILLEESWSPTPGDEYLIRAEDGLLFGTRDALLAYRSGVSVGITAPASSSFISGISTAFSLGSPHILEEGAIVQKAAGLHVSLAHGGVPSVSTKVAALRQILLHPPAGDIHHWSHLISQGDIPLVVETHSADIIATVVLLKREIEKLTQREIKITILGAAEAHLLASDLAEAGVGVLLHPPRPLAYTWDHRRALPGIPLTNESAIATLIKAGVTVGIGPQSTKGEATVGAWAVRNLRFDAGWALLDSPDVLTRASALALASSNVERLLGLRVDPYESDVVATAGGDLLSFEGKVVATISPRRGKVDFFE